MKQAQKQPKESQQQHNPNKTTLTYEETYFGIFLASYETGEPTKEEIYSLVFGCSLKTATFEVEKM